MINWKYKFKSFWCILLGVTNLIFKLRAGEVLEAKCVYEIIRSKTRNLTNYITFLIFKKNNIEL